MNVVPLTVETGRELGSSASRRLRGEGLIPATVYGMGAEPVSVHVDRADLRRALTTAAGVNALIELTFGDQRDYTLVKEVQRHPVRRDPIHIDFQRIDPEKPMSLDVPVVMVGEAKKVTANGGIVEQVLTTLRVSVRPDSIPNQFTIDVSATEIDDVITVADVELPAGVTTEVDETTPVVTATLTRAAMVAQRAADKAAAGADGEAAESGDEGDGGSDD